MKKLHIARLGVLALALVLALGLCACGGENGVETATPAPVETPTATPAPTATPEPTATPMPTSTPEPTPEPSPEATPAATSTPQAVETKKPSEQPKTTQNSSTPQQNATSNNDSPIPGLSVDDHGPYAGSNGNGVTDDRSHDLTDEQVWDPSTKVDTYLGNGGNYTPPPEVQAELDKASDGKMDLNDANWDIPEDDAAARAWTRYAETMTKEEQEEYIKNGGKIYGDP